MLPKNDTGIKSKEKEHTPAHTTNERYGSQKIQKYPDKIHPNRRLNSTSLRTSKTDGRLKDKQYYAHPKISNSSHDQTDSSDSGNSLHKISEQRPRQAFYNRTSTDHSRLQNNRIKAIAVKKKPKDQITSTPMRLIKNAMMRLFRPDPTSKQKEEIFPSPLKLIKNVMAKSSLYFSPNANFPRKKRRQPQLSSTTSDYSLISSRDSNVNLANYSSIQDAVRAIADRQINTRIKHSRFKKGKESLNVSSQKAGIKFQEHSRHEAKQPAVAPKSSLISCLDTDINLVNSTCAEPQIGTRKKHNRCEINDMSLDTFSQNSAINLEKLSYYSKGGASKLDLSTQNMTQPKHRLSNREDPKEQSDADACYIAHDIIRQDQLPVVDKKRNIQLQIRKDDFHGTTGSSVEKIPNQQPVKQDIQKTQTDDKKSLIYCDVSGESSEKSSRVVETQNGTKNTQISEALGQEFIESKKDIGSYSCLWRNAKPKSFKMNKMMPKTSEGDEQDSIKQICIIPKRYSTHLLETPERAKTFEVSSLAEGKENTPTSLPVKSKTEIISSCPTSDISGRRYRIPVPTSQPVASSQEEISNSSEQKKLAYRENVPIKETSSFAIRKKTFSKSLLTEQDKLSTDLNHLDISFLRTTTEQRNDPEVINSQIPTESRKELSLFKGSSCKDKISTISSPSPMLGSSREDETLNVFEFKKSNNPKILPHPPTTLLQNMKISKSISSSRPKDRCHPYPSMHPMPSSKRNLAELSPCMTISEREKTTTKRLLDRVPIESDLKEQSDADALELKQTCYIAHDIISGKRQDQLPVVDKKRNIQLQIRKDDFHGTTGSSVEKIPNQQPVKQDIQKTQKDDQKSLIYCDVSGESSERSARVVETQNGTKNTHMSEALVQEFIESKEEIGSYSCLWKNAKPKSFKMNKIMSKTSEGDERDSIKQICIIPKRYNTHLLETPERAKTYKVLSLDISKGKEITSKSQPVKSKTEIISSCPTSDISGRRYRIPVPISQPVAFSKSISSIISKGRVRTIYPSTHPIPAHPQKNRFRVPAESQSESVSESVQTSKDSKTARMVESLRNYKTFNVLELKKTNAFKSIAYESFGFKRQVYNWRHKEFVMNIIKRRIPNRDAGDGIKRINLRPNKNSAQALKFSKGENFHEFDKISTFSATELIVSKASSPPPIMVFKGEWGTDSLSKIKCKEKRSILKSHLPQPVKPHRLSKRSNKKENLSQDQFTVKSSIELSSPAPSERNKTFNSSGKYNENTNIPKAPPPTKVSKLSQFKNISGRRTLTIAPVKDYRKPSNAELRSTYSGSGKFRTRNKTLGNIPKSSEKETLIVKRETPKSEMKGSELRPSRKTSPKEKTPKVKGIKKRRPPATINLSPGEDYNNPIKSKLRLKLTPRNKSLKEETLILKRLSADYLKFGTTNDASSSKGDKNSGTYSSLASKIFKREDAVKTPGSEMKDLSPSSFEGENKKIKTPLPPKLAKSAEPLSPTSGSRKHKPEKRTQKHDKSSRERRQRKDSKRKRTLKHDKSEGLSSSTSKRRKRKQRKRTSKHDKSSEGLSPSIRERRKRKRRKRKRTLKHDNSSEGLSSPTRERRKRTHRKRKRTLKYDESSDGLSSPTRERRKRKCRKRKRTSKHDKSSKGLSPTREIRKRTDRKTKRTLNHDKSSEVLSSSTRERKKRKRRKRKRTLKHGKSSEGLSSSTRERRKRSHRKRKRKLKHDKSSEGLSSSTRERRKRTHRKRKIKLKHDESYEGLSSSTRERGKRSHRKRKRRLKHDKSSKRLSPTRERRKRTHGKSKRTIKHSKSSEVLSSSTSKRRKRSHRKRKRRLKHSKSSEVLSSTHERQKRTNRNTKRKLKHDKSSEVLSSSTRERRKRSHRKRKRNLKHDESSEGLSSSTREGRKRSHRKRKRKLKHDESSEGLSSSTREGRKRSHRKRKGKLKHDKSSEGLSSPTPERRKHKRRKRKRKLYEHTRRKKPLKKDESPEMLFPPSWQKKTDKNT